MGSSMNDEQQDLYDEMDYDTYRAMFDGDD